MLNVTHAPISVIVLSKTTGLFEDPAIHNEIVTFISGKTCFVTLELAFAKG